MSTEDTQSSETPDIASAHSPDEDRPLELVGLEETELTFVDFGAIQFSGDGMVVLSFFQGVHPFFRSQEEYKQINTTKADCVARLIMHPHQFLRVVGLYGQALEKQQNRFKDQQQQHAGAEE